MDKKEPFENGNKTKQYIAIQVSPVSGMGFGEKHVGIKRALREEGGVEFVVSGSQRTRPRPPGLPWQQINKRIAAMRNSCLQALSAFPFIDEGSNGDNSAEKTKKRCRMTTSAAIKNGKLKRQPCTVCGSKKVEAHHEDYAKPLEVVWFCPKHHRKLHGAKP